VLWDKDRPRSPTASEAQPLDHVDKVMEQEAFWLTLSAAAATGLLAGASLDQLIKQLPARHRIGIEAYSAYSQAADLGYGILFYGILGVGSALLCMAAAVVVHLTALLSSVSVPADLGALLAVLHSLTTLRAAPTNFSQRRVQSDPTALSRVFNRFTRWHTARTFLQVINFGVLLWAVVVLVRAEFAI
jgi:hypothetical protein